MPDPVAVVIALDAVEHATVIGLADLGARSGWRSIAKRPGSGRRLRSKRWIAPRRSCRCCPASRKRWLAAHPRFQLHFTPTSSSWLHLVERWFGELTAKTLRRGAHRSVNALNRDIFAWIKTSNDDPKPYVWTKTADQILESISRHCTRVNDSRH